VRIAVIGAGAMGGIYGGALTEAGIDTTLVDISSPLVERLNDDGLTVLRDGKERTLTVRATTDPASVGPVDVALFFVKCYHTDSAATAAAPLVGPETVVASLQNGWGNGEVLARHFPPGQVAVGVSYHSGTVLEPGKVAHTAVNITHLGPYEGESTEGAERLAGALRQAGLEVNVLVGVRTEIWKKLVLNAAALPTSALTGMTAGALGGHAAMLEVVDTLARETVAVARASGYDVDEAERLDRIHAALLAAGDGKASMLQDVEASRRTEIDVINGAVVREGEHQGVPTPMNRAMVSLIMGYEQAHSLA
jgi:2-dehydropantoate 2-reductase